MARKKLKRIIISVVIVLIISLTLVTCFASNYRPADNKPDVTIGKEEAEEMRSKYDLSSKEGQDEYLKELFGKLGVNERFVSAMTNEKLRDGFLNAEGYGSVSSK